MHKYGRNKCRKMAVCVFDIMITHNHYFGVLMELILLLCESFIRHREKNLFATNFGAVDNQAATQLHR